MTFRLLSVLALIVFAAMGFAFASLEMGVFAVIGLALAAGLTLWAQWRVPAAVLLVAGVVLIGGGIALQGNLAVWFGMYGESLIEPHPSARIALALAGAGAWVLVLFGRSVAESGGEIGSPTG